MSKSIALKIALVLLLITLTGCVHTDFTALIADLNMPKQNIGSVPYAVGNLADIKNPIFSAEFGQKGLWTPNAFLRDSGIGVYFLDPYDRGKIPVLCINGIGGSPKEWEYFIANLDKSRFQTWFAYYPSGRRLIETVTDLNYVIEELHKIYGFDKLFIVAHSMGGLIGRGLLIKNATTGNSYIKLFISISTPWNGHEASVSGVKYAPAVIPVWNDLVPDSEFQKYIFSVSLPEDIKYYLLFSYHGDRYPWRENNDGVVTLKSQLRAEAQSDAEKVIGFDVDHDEILQNEKVAKLCQSLMKNRVNTFH